MSALSMKPPGRRHLSVVLLALAQLALMAMGPFIDAPPGPAGHQHHIAAESTEGCHPYHDEHCVVCRVLSTEAVESAPACGLLSLPPAVATPSLVPPERIAPLLARSTLQPRAPPAT